ncbi:Prolyl oligopeptidase family protein [Seinonella peptonophila]|uniref:Prolyl oligopeptidase family protein n=1 Tax=Seinonella peptonophila TaxID=112248 RepID=A0A1M4ZNQ0_9BACL|nr:prolyl oligopeptidase family serine peptidase [Seinonella peptonophila]SHF19545.1 Prolyl oligopeptidase family protein [Seinonella peptonophila]
MDAGKLVPKFNIHLMKRITSTALVSIAGTIAISECIIWKALTPKRKPLIKDIDLPFYENITIENTDGDRRNQKFKLQGWLVRPQKESKGLVIFTHGYSGNRISNPTVRGLLKEFHLRGYTCLLYDSRRCGESEGKKITGGVFEPNDLLAVTRDALYKYGFKGHPIFYYGYSFGGATSIVTALKAKQEFGQDFQICGVIADSSFSDMKTYIQDYVPHLAAQKISGGHFIAKGLLPVIMGMAKLKKIDPESPLKAVQSLDFPPLFLVHSKHDYAIPASESVKLWQNYHGKGPVMLWLTDAQGHVKSYLQSPEVYISNVFHFTNIGSKRLRSSLFQASSKGKEELIFEKIIYKDNQSREIE